MRATQERARLLLVRVCGGSNPYHLGRGPVLTQHWATPREIWRTIARRREPGEKHCTMPPRPEDERPAVGTPARGGRLSPAEELRTAVGAGRPVRRGRSEPAAQGNSWSHDRQLPAELLHELLARPEATMKPCAAVVVGLRITGRLNLEAAELLRRRGPAARGVERRPGRAASPPARPSSPPRR
jgi:hypothetical protein